MAPVNSKGVESHLILREYSRGNKTKSSVAPVAVQQESAGTAGESDGCDLKLTEASEEMISLSRRLANKASF